MESHLFPFKQNNLWGFIDIQGTIIIQPEYDRVTDIYDGVFFGSKKGFPPFGDNLVSIETGEIIKSGLSFQHWNFEQGYAKIIFPEFEGFIDTKGELFNFYPLKVINYHEGLICAKKKNKYGCIDITGAEKVEFKYDNEISFHNGIASVILPGQKGYCFIDKSGNIVLKGPYTKAGFYSEGKMSVSLGHKLGYIDISGKWLIPPVLDIAHHFIDGLAFVSMNGTEGFINHNREFVIKGKTYGNFSEGFALVQDENKLFGFIDKAGQYLVAPQFIEAESFKNGLAKVVIKKLEVPGQKITTGQIIDATMNENSIYKDWQYHASTKYHGISDGFYYYLNREGKIIYPANIPETLISVEEYREKSKPGFIFPPGTFVPEVKAEDAVIKPSANVVEETAVDTVKISGKNENQSGPVVSSRESRIKQLFIEFVTPLKFSEYLYTSAYPLTGLILGFLFGNLMIQPNAGYLYPVFTLSQDLGSLIDLICALTGFLIGTSFRKVTFEAGGFKKLLNLQNLSIAVLVILTGFKIHTGHYYLYSNLFSNGLVFQVAFFSFFFTGIWLGQIIGYMFTELTSGLRSLFIRLCVIQYLPSYIISYYFLMDHSTVLPHDLILIYFFVSLLFTTIFINIRSFKDLAESSWHSYWSLFMFKQFNSNSEKMLSFSKEELDQKEYLANTILELKVLQFNKIRALQGFIVLVISNMVVGLTSWVSLSLLPGIEVFTK